MKYLKASVIAVLALGILAYLIWRGYDLSWTGFQGYVDSEGKTVPPKKLWDWLSLLVVPLVLAFAAWWLNAAQKKSEQAIESDRQRQKTLEDYFACMTELLLKEKLLGVTASGSAKAIARTRTLVALRILDSGRKAQVLQFLCESGLVNKPAAFQLNGADLRDAILDEATLYGCELRGVYFERASLRRANLQSADLRGSNFSGADLTEAKLNNATLTQASFRSATLTKSDMTGAAIDQVDLTEAITTNAKIPLP